MPKFIGHLQNVTVSLGREATFTCTVTHLGGHRVSITIGEKIKHLIIYIDLHNSSINVYFLYTNLSRLRG